MEAKDKVKQYLFYLKGAAIAKGITYQQIADKTGFKQSNVCRMLNGENITFENLIKLSDAIGCDLSLKMIN